VSGVESARERVVRTTWEVTFTRREGFRRNRCREARVINSSSLLLCAD
jgi:hypothetical protein